MTHTHRRRRDIFVFITDNILIARIGILCKNKANVRLFDAEIIKGQITNQPAVLIVLC